MELTEEQVGEMCMEMIADYPLYASTCGITYGQAIRLAQALDFSEYHAQLRELEQKMEKQLKESKVKND